MKKRMYHPVIVSGTLILLLMLGLGCTSKGPVEFYVAPDGNDSGSGSMSDPFASLERARDAVRALKLSVTPLEQGVTVFIRGGTYMVTEPLHLTAEDSGSEAAPVVWTGYPGEEVILTGGKTVTGFGPVQESPAANRIDPAYRDKIVQANLPKQGIIDFGEIDPKTGNRMELFHRHMYMTIARFPNEGWLNIADVPQTGEKMVHRGLDRDKSPVPRGRHYGRFTYDGDRPSRWENTGDIWMQGYWTWDWSDQYLQVDKIDTQKRDIYPTEPHHSYGYTKGQRYFVLNVLEELDQPGEWYLDRPSGTLYFWPPEPLADGDVYVSMLEEPMFVLDGTEFVTIERITCEGGRGQAITIKDGSDNKVAGCAFRNFGMTVISVNGGARNGVESCDIHTIAAGGIELHGGDTYTLTRAGHYAVNNHIHHIGIRLKTYQPGIRMTGVGNRAAHNLIHDGPHTGLFLSTGNVGNDHLIEYNELHSLAKETGDVGAIYLCARNYTFRGTMIRYNYLHHLFGPGLHGVMAVYLDDFTSGTTQYGNIFYKAGRASFVGGGRNNTIENNVYIECAPSVHVDARGLGWAASALKGGKDGRYYQHLVEKNFTEPPFSERYPELLGLFDDDPAVPKYNVIRHNVSYGGRWLDLYNGMDFDIVTVKDNLIADPVLCKWLKKGESGFKEYQNGDEEIMDILEENGNRIMTTDPGFVDVENADFALKEDSPAFDMGFEAIPVDSIGLYIDQYRTVLPPKFRE